jgi:cytoskeleton protein RodZ
LSETVPHNNGSPLASLGAVLRRCREYHGISLDEAVEATKMGRNYLLALENDRTEEFANQAYLKGFLRTYATYLGLNPDDMVRQFEKQQGQRHGLPAAAQQRGGTGGDAEIPKKRMSLRKFVLPAFLLLLIIITASIINRSGTSPRREQPVPPAPQPQPVPATAPVPAIQPVRSSVHTPPPPQKTEKKPLPATGQSKESPPADQNNVPALPSEPSKSFIMRMKVSQNGTLTVIIDGGQSQTYDLTVGDAIEWKAEKNIALELSNAGGVEVEINGKALKSLGPAGKPVSIVLDADGVRP